ncbi:hypothetical protein EZS27_004528 [termite gut metagenome]|uniref:Uncharacterized protein n=1 Tax=termite gut metagenome TaxID=433724 RepID=A0A5J4SPR7_9ZZZZ
MEADKRIDLPRGRLQEVAAELHVTRKTLSAALNFHTKSVKANDLRRVVLLDYNGDLIGCNEKEKMRLYKKLGIDVPDSPRRESARLKD